LSLASRVVSQDEIVGGFRSTSVSDQLRYPLRAVERDPPDEKVRDSHLQAGLDVN
jgi:hypothetical protein